MNKAVVVFFLALFSLAGMAYAQTSADAAGETSELSDAGVPTGKNAANLLTGGRPNRVFAYPGKECPPGSFPYGGPEQAEIQKVGGIYCSFGHKYVWFRKDKMTKCPDGKDPVPGGIVKEGIMWCDMPFAEFTHDNIYMAKESEARVAQRKDHFVTDHPEVPGSGVAVPTAKTPAAAKPTTPVPAQ